MADEFTCNTFPFRFTIPPASLDPSVPRPGPYLFHGGGMQNPQYPRLSTNALQFMPAASLRSTSSSASLPTSFISTGESNENSPAEGSVNRNRCPNWSDAETRFLLEISKLWKIITPEAETTDEPLNTSTKSTKCWVASQTSHQSAYLNVVWPLKIPALKRMKIHRKPVRQSTRRMTTNRKWSSRRPYPLKETSSPSEKYGENQ